MSDLLSPILVVMQNELEAFWCFAGWLEKIVSFFPNIRIDVLQIFLYTYIFKTLVIFDFLLTEYIYN